MAHAFNRDELSAGNLPGHCYGVCEGQYGVLGAVNYEGRRGDGGQARAPGRRFGFGNWYVLTVTENITLAIVLKRRPSHYLRFVNWEGVTRNHVCLVHEGS